MSMCVTVCVFLLRVRSPPGCLQVSQNKVCKIIGFQGVTSLTELCKIIGFQGVTKFLTLKLLAVESLLTTLPYYSPNFARCLYRS